VKPRAQILLLASSVALGAWACVAETPVGAGDIAVDSRPPAPATADVSGCGDPVIPKVDESFADPMTRRGPTVYPPILGPAVERVLTVDGANDVTFTPLAPVAPPSAPLQLILLDSDGVLRLYFGGPAIAEGMTLPEFVSGGGVVVLEKPLAGQDADLVVTTVGSRAGRIAVGPHGGALVHADPVGTGVRTWNLYWSDGERDWSIIGGVDPETVVTLGRSLYCGG
jgi:hypothetical protein